MLQGHRTWMRQAHWPFYLPRMPQSLATALGRSSSRLRCSQSRTSPVEASKPPAQSLLLPDGCWSCFEPKWGLSLLKGWYRSSSAESSALLTLNVPNESIVRSILAITIAPMSEPRFPEEPALRAAGPRVVTVWIDQWSTSESFALVLSSSRSLAHGSLPLWGS